MSNYDLVAVGTGFATTFFLHRYLEARPNAKILVLERGRNPASGDKLETPGTFRKTGDPRKQWIYTLAFGGGSNCWWACTPRMLPHDFQLNTRYGVGADWPMSYDEFEPYYLQAENIMNISGPSDGGPAPRSGPYPQPPHRFSDPDRLMKAAYPDLYYNQATARARVATPERVMCCANGVCNKCPVSAKFMIKHDLAAMYAKANIEIRFDAEVLRIETAAGAVSGVAYRSNGAETTVAGDLYLLGANAVYNPLILQNSGLSHPWLGAGLCEQSSRLGYVLLDGVDNYSGSTVITGQGYMLYDGDHRREAAACMLEVWNKGLLRPEWGKWRQRLDLKMICEDIPSQQSTVRPSSDDPHIPVLHFPGISEYTRRGFDRARGKLADVLVPLPVEDLFIEDEPEVEGEAHILCTARMGADPADSVVDNGLVHHQFRNLVVAGGSAFPTASPANPSLTISALSLFAADRLVGGVTEI
ncbi:MAG: GMC family oxidoreductase [Parvularculaceae bacterium]